MLFTEVDFLQRFEAAARAGFTAVEYMFPYDYEPAVLRQQLAAHGLTQALFNLPAGDWAAGERGFACDPARVAEFEAGVGRAIEYAGALDCPRVNCLVGITTAIAPRTARETLLRNLRHAAPRLEEAGVALAIEAVNTRDVPGFFLSTTAQALEIIDAVGSNNLFVQYDVYHMQMMGEDVFATLERAITKVAHIQVADVPGRHEPGTGTIDYPALFALLDRLGYTGWVGGEYKPQGRTEDGLAWAKPYLR
jgi:hydroxypyruvate isomerase